MRFFNAAFLAGAAFFLARSETRAATPTVAARDPDKAHAEQAGSGAWTG